MADLPRAFLLAGGQVFEEGRLFMIKQCRTKQHWFYVCE